MTSCQKSNAPAITGRGIGVLHETLSSNHGGHGPQPPITASRSSTSTLLALVPVLTTFAGQAAGGAGHGPHWPITASRSSTSTLLALVPELTMLAGQGEPPETVISIDHDPRLPVSALHQSST